MSLEARPLLVIEADVEAPADLGARRMIAITGGRVTGAVSGVVLPGADWQSVRADGALEISAHYAIRTHDGALIEVKSDGVRSGPPEVLAALGRGEAVDASRYYFRTAMRFHTAAAQHARFNGLLAVAKGERRASVVRLEVFEIL